jgi:hypothetical protein
MGSAVSRCTVPRELLTGHDSPADIVTGLEAGADDYVRKPARAPELLARLKTGSTAGRAGIRLHMGATQGLLAVLVGDAAPAHWRGTAFGLFNLVGGLALLAASIIAGGLWSSVGPKATFLAGAAFALISGCGLFAVSGWPKKPVAF